MQCLEEESTDENDTKGEEEDDDIKVEERKLG